MDNPLNDVMMSSVFCNGWLRILTTGAGGSSSSSVTACCLCNFILLPEGSSVTLSMTSMTTDGDVGTLLGDDKAVISLDGVEPTKHLHKVLVLLYYTVMKTLIKQKKLW